MNENSRKNLRMYKGRPQEVGEDFFETPRKAILPIRKYIPEGVKKILEPTYGLGAIGNILEEWGYEVIKRDLYPKTADTTKADFLKDDIPECDMIIFNPPFCLKTQFLKRVCETGKPFLFICPITIMETEKRFNIFKDYQLSVLNLPHRINYMSKPGCCDSKVWFHSIWVMRHPDYKNNIVYAESTP